MTDPRSAAQDAELVGWEKGDPDNPTDMRDYEDPNIDAQSPSNTAPALAKDDESPKPPLRLTDLPKEILIEILKNYYARGAYEPDEETEEYLDWIEADFDMVSCAQTCWKLNRVSFTILGDLQRTAVERGLNRPSISENDGWEEVYDQHDQQRVWWEYEWEYGS